MVDYTKGEAREWAREHLSGVHNVIIPSYDPQSFTLNTEGIRHDVRRDLELGFAGALMVSETALTMDEYVQFVRTAAEESQGRLVIIHHASFNSLEENIEAVKQAEEAGAQLVLLSYPPSFYPKSLEEIYTYTRTVAESTRLGVILFPVPLWDFERLDASCLPMEMMQRLIDDVPNIVAIKAEGGVPSIGGFSQAWNLFNEQVVVTMPLVHQAIPLATLVPMQAIATSNSEYFGNTVPEMLRLIRDGKSAEAMGIFWRIDPAVRANSNVADITSAGQIVHRWAWKYQAWLTGFNGGPLRMPTARLTTRQMGGFRQALIDSEIDVTADGDEAFFAGRVR